MSFHLLQICATPAQNFSVRCQIPAHTGIYRKAGRGIALSQVFDFLRNSWFHKESFRIKHFD